MSEKEQIESEIAVAEAKLTRLRNELELADKDLNIQMSVRQAVAILNLIDMLSDEYMIVMNYEDDPMMYGFQDSFVRTFVDGGLRIRIALEDSDVRIWTFEMPTKSFDVRRWNSINPDEN